MEQRPKKLLEQMQDVIRLKHYSYQTEKTYIYWIRRYILFHNKRHPKDMGSKEIEEFLTHLAVNENVAASTQNQALHAVLFLYKKVLKQDLDLKVDAVYDWIWQFVFPSGSISQDPRSGEVLFEKPCYVVTTFMKVVYKKR